MNEQDKKAMCKAFVEVAARGWSQLQHDDFEAGWQAALEYARQQEPVAWSVVFNAVKQAIELCKNATGQHSTISRYVNPVQITHDALGTDTTNPAQPVPPDDLRQAALIDLAYINGAKAGWNMCS